MRGTTLFSLALPVLLALPGCTPHADKDSLYPLTPGLTWEYRIETQRKGLPAKSEIQRMANVSRESFAGEHDVAIRRNIGGARYFVVRRDDGFYRLAVKSVISHTPILDKPPVKILPLPIEEGATWREPAHTYMLGRAKTFIAEQTPANTITLDYHVESTSADVDVPAGHFKNCVLVIGEAMFHLGQGAGLEASDIPISQKEWYCRGIGLTQMVRDEKLTTNNLKRVITGGYLKMQLVQGPE